MSRAAALVAAVAALVVAAAAGLLLFQVLDPGEIQVTTEPTEVTTEPLPASEPTLQPALPPTTTHAPSEDGATTQPDPTLADVVPSAVFEDQWVEDAMQQGLAAPSTALPSRDLIATAVLNEQIGAGGYDLTGMRLTIYPDGPIPSFVLVETADDTALIAADLAENPEGEDFLTDLITADALTQFQVETFVLQHTGVDDVGPFVLTLTVGLADLQDGLTTGADVFDKIAAQVERP